MKKQKKSILGAIAVSAALISAVCFSACTPESYSIEKLEDYVSAATVTSNGGFVVQKGEFVYFINGEAAYNADNTFGNAKKGALMRIRETDLQKGDYEKAQTVVPMLFVSQDYDSGIFIHGDYVYYATPTTDKDEYGNVKNTMIDFKRAKLDGTDTMGGYFFQSSDNDGQFRFVKGENGVVYCLYVENGVLSAFNTSTYEKKVLVKGAASEFFFDNVNKESGKVYYTMAPVKDEVKDGTVAAFDYNQIYCVTPDAYATVDGNVGSYTVHNTAGERTYDYSDMKGDLEASYSGFNAWDYTSYPYVNLGELVLDGIGSDKVLCPTTMYNDEADVTAAVGHIEMLGYTYTLKANENGNVYYTRNKVAGDSESALYFLDENTINLANWNTVEGNLPTKLDVAAKDNAFASNAEIMYLYDGAKHTYLYSDGSAIYKSGTDYAKPIKMTDASSATLLMLNGNYLYYTVNNKLTRINYTSDNEDHYEFAYDVSEDLAGEYKPSEIAQVSVDTSWYKPEFVGEVLLYNNADAYNYIYAIDLGVKYDDGGTEQIRGMTAKEINAVIEKYNEFEDYLLNDITDDAVRNAMRYIYKADSLEAFTAVEDLYTDVQVEEVKAFFERRLSTNKSANDYTDKFVDDEGVAYDRATYFVGQVGEMTDEDKETMKTANAANLLKRTETAADESFPVWAIVLISVGGALIVAAGVTVPVVYFYKKKKKRLADIEATKVRKRRQKIDTTDDKTIDVYADDSVKAADDDAESVQEPDEAVEEIADEAVEETAENAVEDATNDVQADAAEEKAKDAE